MANFICDVLDCEFVYLHVFLVSESTVALIPVVRLQECCTSLVRSAAAVSDTGHFEFLATTFTLERHVRVPLALQVLLCLFVIFEKQNVIFLVFRQQLLQVVATFRQGNHPVHRVILSFKTMDAVLCCVGCSVSSKAILAHLLRLVVPHVCVILAETELPYEAALLGMNTFH